MTDLGSQALRGGRMNEAVLIDRGGRPTRAWFPSAVEGERKPGAPLRFPFDRNVAEAFTGEVTEWEPMRVFAFTWNHDQLRIELVPEADGTRLVFTHAVYDRSVAARTGAGWDTCLTNLDHHLGGPAPEGDWRSTYRDYLERMGPPPARMSRDWALEYERAHHVSPARLWQCLTDAGELRSWTGFDVTIEPRLGGRTCWFDRSEHPEEGVVVALEHERRLAYTFGGLSVVEWEIEPTDFGCRYRMRHHGLDRDNAVGKGSGWHGFLLQLDVYAASGQLVEDTEADMQGRLPDYEEIARAVTA
jgi:uncharacterized protein YndB with AHSA1/START domain